MLAFENGGRIDHGIVLFEEGFEQSNQVCLHGVGQDRQDAFPSPLGRRRNLGEELFARRGKFQLHAALVTLVCRSLNEFALFEQSDDEPHSRTVEPREAAERDLINSRVCVQYVKRAVLGRSNVEFAALLDEDRRCHLLATLEQETGPPVQVGKKGQFFHTPKESMLEGRMSMDRP